VQTLQSIDVAPIEGGKSGWLVRNALIDRLDNSGGTKQFQLKVELDDKIEGFGVRSDDAVTRERRTLRARYKLTDAAGKVLLDATAGSDVGIDVVSSEYATIAAENTALERLSGIVADQIIARIALYAERPTAK
jgi:LPS-assembly lipoprotein